MPQERIDYGYGVQLWQDDDRIYRIIIATDANAPDQTYAMLRRAYKHVGDELSEHNGFYRALIDMRQVRISTKLLTTFDDIIKDVPTFTYGYEAYVLEKNTTGNVLKAVGNPFLQRLPNRIEALIFSDLDEALAWLRQQGDPHQP